MCPGCSEPFGSGEKPQLACSVTGHGAGQTCGFESEQGPYPKLWLPHLGNGDGEVYPSVPWRMTEPRLQNIPTLACSRVSLPLCCLENVPLTSGGQGSRQKSYWFSALSTLLNFRFPFADKALKKNFPLKTVNAHSHCHSTVFPYLPFKTLILALTKKQDYSSLSDLNVTPSLRFACFLDYAVCFPGFCVSDGTIHGFWFQPWAARRASLPARISTAL